MSRVSHVARADRLMRQLRDQPVVTITFAPWLLALEAEVERRRRAPSEEPEALVPRSDAPEAGRS